MKASSKPKKILWMDLEMTGLDPVHDEILEVAAIATDWDFTEIATYEGVVRHDPEKLSTLLDRNASFWNEHPEARRGLEEQNMSGKPLAEVERELLAFCDEYFADESRILLGGNSIHQDRRFIDQWWQMLSLTMCHLNVSVAMVFLSRLRLVALLIINPWEEQFCIQRLRLYKLQK